MTIKNNLIETQNNFEVTKIILNPLLELYIEERTLKIYPTFQKNIFIKKLSSFSLDEKRAYRDYLYKLIKNSVGINETIKEDGQIIALLDNIKSLDKLEIYAGVCNSCKSDILETIV